MKTRQTFDRLKSGGLPWLQVMVCPSSLLRIRMLDLRLRHFAICGAATATAAGFVLRFECCVEVEHRSQEDESDNDEFDRFHTECGIVGWLIR